MSATGEPAGPASMRPVVLLSMAGFCSMATMRVVDPLLPEVAAEFATTPGNASVIGTAFAVAYGMFQVAYGPLGDRFGKYRVIATAIAGATVAVAATALAESLFTLACLRFAAGAATAAAIPLSLAYIGDITAYEQRQQELDDTDHQEVFGRPADLRHRVGGSSHAEKLRRHGGAEHEEREQRGHDPAGFDHGRALSELQFQSAPVTRPTSVPSGPRTAVT